MKTSQIYSYVENLTSLVKDNDLYIPAKANYYIQRNFAELEKIYTDIEKTRFDIISHFGELQEDGSYMVLENNLDKARQELDDLLELDQDVTILKISLDALGDIQLTPKQMQALMFMIEE